MNELVNKLEQRLGLPEKKVQSILDATIRYIEIHYPEYISLMEQVIISAKKEREEVK